MRWEESGLELVGWDGVGCLDGMGLNGIGLDWMGWDGMGLDWMRLDWIEWDEIKPARFFPYFLNRKRVGQGVVYL